MPKPQLLIIAGPNGAGKSTCAPFLVPPALPFVNADEIALALGDADLPGRDFKAGRIMLETIDRFVHAGDSFVIETTLANRMLAARIPSIQTAGYEVQLTYVWLPSADEAVNRVADRASRGGHSVPEETIRRRYGKSLLNLRTIYLSVVDIWRVYRNVAELGPLLIAEGDKSGRIFVVDDDAWNSIDETVRNEQGRG